MLNQISFYIVGGLPLIAWGGLLTLLCMLFTAAIAIMNQRGIHKIPMGWHFVMAKITIALGLIHGISGMLSFL